MEKRRKRQGTGRTTWRRGSGWATICAVKVQREGGGAFASPLASAPAFLGDGVQSEERLSLPHVNFPRRAIAPRLPTYS